MWSLGCILGKQFYFYLYFMELIFSWTLYRIAYISWRKWAWTNGLYNGSFFGSTYWFAREINEKKSVFWLEKSTSIFGELTWEKAKTGSKKFVVHDRNWWKRFYWLSHKLFFVSCDSNYQIVWHRNFYLKIRGKLIQCTYQNVFDPLSYIFTAMSNFLYKC